MTHLDWQDETYRRIFRDVRSQLRRRVETEPGFGAAEVRGFLETAYVNQGNDWLGRGAVHDTIEAATIAAHEAILAELTAEDGPEDTNE
jgi:cephalosporin-C deacetylase-like acetyl esterase